MSTYETGAAQKRQDDSNGSSLDAEGAEEENGEEDRLASYRGNKALVARSHLVPDLRPSIRLDVRPSIRFASIYKIYI